MALDVGNLRRLGEFLMSRPEVRSRARDVTREGIGVSRQLNPPKLITIFVAVALAAVGLAVTILPIDTVNDLLKDADITLGREEGWLALIASPVLLIAGSILRGL
jgi:hypothetical protein